MDSEQISVEFFNSPRYRFLLELPDRKIDWEFAPYVAIYGTLEEEDEEIEISLTLQKKGRIVKEGRLSSSLENNRFSVEFKLDQPLDVLPDTATVFLKCFPKEHSLTKELKYARLSGRVEDFSGKPLKGALVFITKTRAGTIEQSDTVIAISGENGQYEISLPKGFYKGDNFVLLNDWGTKTLENYFLELNLDQDRELDFRIDQAEVAFLAPTVIRDNSTFSLRFVCWSINESTLPYFRALEEEESADLSEARFIPQLKQEEVEIFTDEIPAEIVAFESVPVQNITGQLTPGWYVDGIAPSSIGQGAHILKVVVHHKSKDPGGQDVVEHGQAQYCDLRWS